MENQRASDIIQNTEYAARLTSDFPYTNFLLTWRYHKRLNS